MQCAEKIDAMDHIHHAYSRSAFRFYHQQKKIKFSTTQNKGKQTPHPQRTAHVAIGDELQQSRMKWKFG
jgi:hypothetical protein